VAYAFPQTGRDGTAGMDGTMAPLAAAPLGTHDYSDSDSDLPQSIGSGLRYTFIHDTGPLDFNWCQLLRLWILIPPHESFGVLISMLAAHLTPA
jgi:hypothetical protein